MDFTEDTFALGRVAREWLTANAGTPSRAAHSAAPTVPDSVLRSPMFCPRLMPDTTRSGGGFIVRMPKTDIKKVKATQIMEKLKIAESRRLRGLGDQQRRALLAEFAPNGR